MFMLLLIFCIGCSPQPTKNITYNLEVYAIPWNGLYRIPWRNAEELFTSQLKRKNIFSIKSSDKIIELVNNCECNYPNGNIENYQDIRVVCILNNNKSKNDTILINSDCTVIINRKYCDKYNELLDSLLKYFPDYLSKSIKRDMR